MSTRLRITGRICFALIAALGAPITVRAGPPPEFDNDGIPDVLDKCMFDSRNAAASCDTDVDGYGNPCDGDFDQSFGINSLDFSSYFIPAFKGLAAPTRGQDMDCNGLVNSVDFSQYFIPKFKGLTPWGAVPGPSGLACAGQQGCQ
jgi:hypothetical protein